MRTIVYGAGAIGGTIAGRLFEGGHNVVAIARGPHLEAIRAVGLTLADPDRSVTLPVPAVGHPSELTFGTDDVVVLAMKTQHTAAALDDLLAVAPPDIPIVCAQNGVDNERSALRRSAKVHGMCVMLPAEHLEPGLVWVLSSPVTGMLDVGRYPGGADEVDEQLSAALDACGFDSIVRLDVMRWKYSKLRMNLANALDAAVGEAARGTDLFKRAIAEAEACFDAAGIDRATLDEDRARRGDLLHLRSVGDHDRTGGSSYQSLARGTGSIESDFLNGEIVLLGRLHGVATPVNTVLQRTAKRMAAAGAPPRSHDITELLAEIAAEPAA